jgi:hypothetical protein
VKRDLATVKRAFQRAKAPDHAVEVTYATNGTEVPAFSERLRWPSARRALNWWRSESSGRRGPSPRKLVADPRTTRCDGTHGERHRRVRRLPSHRLMRHGPHRAVTLERWGAAPVSRDGLSSDSRRFGASVRASTGLIGGQRARRLQTGLTATPRGRAGMSAHCTRLHPVRARRSGLWPTLSGPTMEPIPYPMQLRRCRRRPGRRTPGAY